MSWCRHLARVVAGASLALIVGCWADHDLRRADAAFERGDWSDGKRGWGLLGAECAFAPTPMSAIRLRWQVEGLAMGEGRAGERLDAPGQSASLLLGYDRVVVEAGWTSRSVISTRSQRFGTNRLDESAHSDERLLRLGVGWRF